MDRRDDRAGLPTEVATGLGGERFGLGRLVLACWEIPSKRSGGLATAMPVGNKVRAERRGGKPPPPRAQPSSFRFRIWLTSAGLALPPVAFIVWPMKKPKSLSLPPRYSDRKSDV